MDLEPSEGEEFFEGEDSHKKDVGQTRKKLSRSQKRRQIKRMKEAENIFLPWWKQTETMTPAQVAKRRTEKKK